MRNWLGQEILPGSIVYRGARQGTGSDYKIGVVDSVTGEKARVKWKYFCTQLRQYVIDGQYANGRDYGHWESYGLVAQDGMSAGNPSIESLVVLTESHLVAADESNKLLKEFLARQDAGDPMSKQEFLDRQETLWYTLGG